MTVSPKMDYILNKGIEIYRLIKGRPYAWLALGFMGIAALLAGGPQWIVFPFVYLGWITPNQAVDLFSPSVLTLSIALAFGFLSAGILVFGMIHDKASTSQKSTVIALKHKSFEGNVQDLTIEHLARSQRNSEIIYENLDQTPFYLNGTMTAPEAALQQQHSLSIKIKTLINAHPGSKLAYYGKAHIPFVFAAGHDVQADIPVLHFELERNNGDLRYIQAEQGPDLGITVEGHGAVGPGEQAVIRVSISYLVEPTPINEIITQPYADRHLRIAQPQIDAIVTQEQIDEIAKKFREILDELWSSPTKPKVIHVFCAAPMSIVFALGRRISPTIHPSIIIYNFSSATTPKYAWGLKLNGAIHQQIVYPLQGGHDVQSA